MADRDLRIQIHGMTCTDCEVHVTRALERVGAANARADFRRGEARLRAPGNLSEAALMDAVRQVGYTPVRVEEVRATAAPDVAERGPEGTPAEGIYDLAIVGSGGAAFAAAIRARDRGARVLMIERETVGGTCVNIGCVPSKTLLRAGDVYWEAGHNPFAGVTTGAGNVDLGALATQKDALIAQLRQEKYLDLIADYGWDLLQGEAHFGDDGFLRVNGEVIRATKIVLATGASPAVPSIPGLTEVPYLTSTSALALTKLPTSLIVIGSGYVALELGQLFRHLGSRVTLLQRSPRILKSYDLEISEAVAGVLTAQGIEHVTGVRYERVEKKGGKIVVHVTVDGVPRTVEGERLLVATGRAPNTRALGLDRAGVDVGANGEILVNPHLQTSNPDVYAAGDVTLAPQFVYVAAYEGALAAENVLDGNHRTVDLSALPGVTVTNPAIATVGLTEAQAAQAGHQVKTSVLPAAAVPRAIVNRDTHGVFKIVADAETDQILGVHVVAENAGDVIYAGVLAVKFHLTVHDLVETFAPYLTMAEGLKLAAQTFGRDVHKLSCCAV
ncbi:MAG TPA: mercury(II) reductase [Chloroflexota bacterium]|nr:mercury(II) reductase [Chloroflexota bacterium]